VVPSSQLYTVGDARKLVQVLLNVAEGIEGHFLERGHRTKGVLRLCLRETAVDGGIGHAQEAGEKGDL